MEGHQFVVSDLCFQKSLTQALLFTAGAREGAKKCSYELCECDRTFVKCLSQFACPKSKAMCTSPWRYFQNLFMGLGTGMVSEILKSQRAKEFQKQRDEIPLSIYGAQLLI